MYDHNVFDIIRILKPSQRGELEISDVNAHYLKDHTVTYSKLTGWWSDAGTFDSLAKASSLVAKTPVD